MGATTCTCQPPTPAVCNIISKDGGVADPAKSWDFNTLDLNSEKAGQVAFSLLLSHYSGCCGTREDVLRKFVGQVSSEYLPNPYHNFQHAVDVLQTTLRCGLLVPWQDIISPGRQFSLLVAALAHDLAHPGYNNIFLVDVSDALACRYNDVSPLENMHCSKLFEIAVRPDCDIFAQFSKETFRDLRKFMIDVILNTDTACHRMVTNSLEDFYRKNLDIWSVQRDADGLTKAQSLACSDNSALVARGLLLFADTSNQAKPWEVAQAWGQRLLEEFFLQGDKEKSLGLPVQRLNDRDIGTLPNAQLGAVHVTVAPLLATSLRLFQDFRELGTTTISNVKAWGSQVKGDGSKEDPRVADICARLEGSLEPDPVLIPMGVVLPVPRKESGSPCAEPCSEPSCQSSAHSTVTAPSTLVVREVRRWREQPGDNRDRMLVLLYVWAEEEQDVDGACQPMLLRYTTSPDSVEGPPELGSDIAEPAPEAACLQMGVPDFDLMMSTILEGVPTILAQREAAAAELDNPTDCDPPPRRQWGSSMFGLASPAANMIKKSKWK